MKNKFLIPAILLLVFNFTNLTLSAQKTVVIGAQTWTTKNLDVTKFRNGDKIPEAKTQKEFDTYGAAGEPAWCYLDFNKDNGKKYGKLYNWYAVNDSRGLAPSGYHIPSDIEWSTLVEFLGGLKVAGIKLKAAYGWRDSGNGTNSSGFSALPSAGYGNALAYFWTSTEREEMDVNVKFTHAWYYSLYFSSGLILPEVIQKFYGLAVRCVKN